MDKSLFISGMALIALGRAARFASAKPFIRWQPNNSVNKNSVVARCCPWIPNSVGTTSIFLLVLCFFAFLCMPTAAVLAFPLVEKWYYLFGASAFCTLVATGIYLYSSREYLRPELNSGRSPISNLPRVLVVACCKISQPSSKLDDPSLLYAKKEFEEFDELSHSRCLGFLHKAAIRLPGDAGRAWMVCSVSEVESAKIAIRMVFVYTAFLMGGVVSSVGNTYFVEQALSMNFKIGPWDPPLQLIQILFSLSKVAAEFLWRYGLGNINYSNFTGVNAGMGTTLLSILCCTVSGAVERRRVHAVRRRDLLGMPDDGMVHMGAYWLLFQVIFLGFVEAYLRSELAKFHEDEAPGSMKWYTDCLGEAVVGVGYMCGAFSVYAVGKISGIGSSKNWFRFTLNKSRLDRYYWVLSVLATINMCWCIAVSYSYKTKRTFAPATSEEDVVQSASPTQEKGKKIGRAAGRTWAEILMT